MDLVGKEEIDNVLVGKGEGLCGFCWLKGRRGIVGFVIFE